VIKTFINILLIVAFICLAAVITMLFMAEARFGAAERFVSGYLWKDAGKSMEDAARIDPYDSRYPAGLGEMLFTQAGYKDNQTPLLQQAEKYYLHAVALNPRCAEYFTKLGQIYISLFVDEQKAVSKGQHGRYIDKAFENFKKAIENDPNGFNIAYTVGYSGLSVWMRLNESEKAIVVDRLKYSLKQKPWYSGYVYPRLLQETGNTKLLESITPDIEAKQWVSPEKIGDLKRGVLQGAASDIVSKSGWQGASADGGSIYENGSMYWSGTIYGAMLFPKGNVLIKVEASGSPADGVYPYMLVSLDGKRIGSAYIDNPEFKEYVFTANTDGGIKVLGITFTNDGGNDKEDRNLFVGNAHITKK